MNVRRAISTAAATMAAFVVVVAGAGPAAASGTQCSANYGTSAVHVCATVNTGGFAFGVLERTGSTGGFSNYTLAVEQCDGTGNNCVAFSSQSGPNAGYTYAATLSKACSFGHVYRARASWNDSVSGVRYTNAVTAFVAC